MQNLFQSESPEDFETFPPNGMSDHTQVEIGLKSLLSQSCELCFNPNTDARCDVSRTHFVTINSNKGERMVSLSTCHYLKYY